ncbi:hypothetical protein M8A51_13410 [Schlegelella sp. S2-27]|uniref:Uncharacterized protein n=1 Tax=Caldimonas mangrovi TaxID=2944811 RepID=A0ABT0YP62_9BURK|nr:hypothetical protein [Caldimonas mangrovi]MCM5680525.1 hypothetical protein [Caldimonas mangrovi]
MTEILGIRFVSFAGHLAKGCLAPLVRPLFGERPQGPCVRRTRSCLESTRVADVACSQRRGAARHFAAWRPSYAGTMQTDTSTRAAELLLLPGRNRLADDIVEHGPVFTMPMRWLPRPKSVASAVLALTGQ